MAAGLQFGSVVGDGGGGAVAGVLEGLAADGVLVAVLLGLAEAFDDGRPGVFPGVRCGRLEFVSEGLGGGFLRPAAA